MKLVIANTSIHQDAEGRYSLNDLHRASGGEDRHKPANFLRTDHTQEMIEEINRCSEMSNAISVKQGGRNQGTYACKEMVYAYAMWISAEFHLHVIRAYDALVQGGSNPTKGVGNPSSATRAHLMVVEAMQKIGVRPEMAMAVALQAIHQDTGLTTECYRQALPAIEDVCNLNQKQLGDMLGVSAREVGKLLREAGLMEDDESGQRIVTKKGQKFGEMKPYRHGNGHCGYEPRWNPSVADYLTKEVAN